MSTLVFGKTGQVATELHGILPEAEFLGRDDADLGDPQSCFDAIVVRKPTAVINAAAYTAVDRAEEEEPLAAVINGDAPGAMARACARLDIPFVHISTDYVFDGQGEAAWAPDDPVAPLGAYGRTKLKGEQAVMQAGGRYVILRTSWVFSAHGANFVKTMLRLSETHTMLNVVADQIGGPTPAQDIASACIAIANRLKADGPSGIYHFSGSPAVSWADFARVIFDVAGRSTTVNDIPSSAYPTPATRPANSRLDGTSLRDEFGINAADWRKALLSALRGIS